MAVIQQYPRPHLALYLLREHRIRWLQTVQQDPPGRLSRLQRQRCWSPVRLQTYAFFLYSVHWLILHIGVQQMLLTVMVLIVKVQTT